MELGVDSVCCLLHNLVPGGSARQWIHLLGRHVSRGGRATIVAPPGALEELADNAGIEVVSHTWDDRTPAGCEALWPRVAGHDLAVVHWDHRVMHAFGPALHACGRAALVVHQAPRALARWFGPEILPDARRPLADAVAARRAVVLVRGERHRDRIASAFELPARKLAILPASIPLPPPPPQPASDEAGDVLALMRFSPDKAPLVQLAVELVRARLAAAEPCRLALAGEGPWRSEAIGLCAQRLPSGSWRVEPAPPEPISRLAAADVVVAQGLTTLEAAALGRRVVVARAVDGRRAAGTVLIPDRYDSAARDPFGEPAVTADPNVLWREILALDQEDLRSQRQLVERHNSLEGASRALATALAKTAGWRTRLPRRPP